MTTRTTKLSAAHVVLSAILLFGTGGAACARRTDVAIGRDCAQGFCEDPPPTFTSPDAGDDGAPVEPPAPVLACIGTACPWPYATCSTTSAIQCGTDLMNDPANCGACGVECRGIDGLNLNARCVQGACVLECQIKPRPGASKEAYEYADCNHLLDDGCEVNLTTDAANCGACGNACPAGERCIRGKCGCGPGLYDCDGNCVDRRFDDNNCNACRRACALEPPPVPCTPMPPQTRYGCVDSDCGKLKCFPGWADCNGDLGDGCASNGCETNTNVDPNHCGGCNVKCGPGQECRMDLGGGGPQCRDTCETAGHTQCGQQCADLLTDVSHCGACWALCPAPGPNQLVACEKGLCTAECLPGFADCNGDRGDGCEIDIRNHPENCGACGNECDLGVGQPCIEGKCLMVECDAGVVPK